METQITMEEKNRLDYLMDCYTESLTSGRFVHSFMMRKYNISPFFVMAVKRNGIIKSFTTDKKLGSKYYPKVVPNIQLVKRLMADENLYAGNYTPPVKKEVGKIDIKKCYHCDSFKKKSEFNKDRSKYDELQSMCKTCYSQYRKNKKWNVKKEKKENNIINKYCSHCDTIKDVKEFNKKIESKDGLQPYCIKCQKLVNKKYNDSKRTTIDIVPEIIKNTNASNYIRIKKSTIKTAILIIGTFGIGYLIREIINLFR
jgi:hypothetical protein